MTDEEAANLLAHYAELLSNSFDGKRSSYGLLMDAGVIVGKIISNTEQGIAIPDRQ